MPKISVIMPIYNVEKYIKNSIESVCEQTFHDFELILINDGSTDASVSIAMNVLKNANIDWKLINQENKGVSAARNNGIRHSRGEWIIMLDSDDCIHPMVFEIFSRFFKDKIDLIGFNYKMINSSDIDFEEITGKVEIEVFDKNELINAFLYRKIRIILPALIIRKELIIENNLFFIEECHYSEDIIYIWMIILNIKKMQYINEPFYHYLNRPNSTMTSSNLEKILTGYSGFVQFNNYLHSLNTTDIGIDTDYIFSRWVIGILHSSSKLLSFSDFKKLSEKMEYKKHTRKMMAFKDKRISILARLLLLSRFCSYQIMKKI